jgi:hypothetical protein
MVEEKKRLFLLFIRLLEDIILITTLLKVRGGGRVMERGGGV